MMDRPRQPGTGLLIAVAAAGAVAALIAAQRRRAEIERRTEERLHPRADFEVGGR